MSKKLATVARVQSAGRVTNSLDAKTYCRQIECALPRASSSPDQARPGQLEPGRARAGQDGAMAMTMAIAEALAFIMQIFQL